MTARAVILGLALGLVVSVATYFNDWIIGQTQLIGNFLPISVFGFAVFYLLVLNPVLQRLGRRFPLKGSEIAVMTAIGLAACGWPGSNFFRGFTPVTALPAHWLKTSPSWQANQLMAYVPGASAHLGQGHVQDWPKLVKSVAGAKDAVEPSPGRQVWLSLGDQGQRLFQDAASKGQVELNQIPELTRSLNTALKSESFYAAAAFQGVSVPDDVRPLFERRDLAPYEVERRNRWLLVGAFPDAIMPPPRGEGLLVDGGRADPLVVDTLMQGRSSNNRLSLAEIPWKVWWPTIKLWGGAALLLGLCSLCLALIVHPQWSRRELLPYPIVRFINEASERKPGSKLPEVTRSRLFWLAFALIAVWHLINGLHAWIPEVPEIPRKFEFWSLSQVFPNAVRVSGQYGWFGPTMYLSVIAFSFFMSTSVSFSLGIAHILFFMLGSVLIANSIQLDSQTTGASPSALLKFGGYLGAGLIIGYTGRRYYKNLAFAALGRPPAADTPGYAIWALRGLGVFGLLTVLSLNSAGLPWGFSALLVFLMLLTFLVMTRIVCETGNFFVQCGWAPMGVVTALLGFESIGPTAFIVLALASVILVLDPREAIMPYLSNGLKMTDREGGASPSKISVWLVVMMTSGFVVAGVVTHYLQYNDSVIQVGNSWGTHTKPKFAFDAMARLVSDSAANGSLARATAMSGTERLAAIDPGDGAVMWLAIGFALVLGASAARLRLPWWPLHPVAFLVWDTYPLIMFGPSFLLGWVVKASVIGTTGARGYHQVKPLMIGVIASELLMGLFWMAVGAVYYFYTGQRPVTYSIFPL